MFLVWGTNQESTTFRHNTTKLPAENTGKTSSDINRNYFPSSSPKAKERKAKINKWDLIKLRSFSTAKENHQQNEKTTYGSGENICRQCDQRGLISKLNSSYSSIPKTKQKTPNQNVSREPKQMFFWRRHTCGQQAHEEMLNITNYYRNANQNYNKVSAHTGQNSHHQKYCK